MIQNETLSYEIVDVVSKHHNQQYFPRIQTTSKINLYKHLITNNTSEKNQERNDSRGDFQYFITHVEEKTARGNVNNENCVRVFTRFRLYNAEDLTSWRYSKSTNSKEMSCLWMLLGISLILLASPGSVSSKVWMHSIQSVENVIPKETTTTKAPSETTVRISFLLAIFVNVDLF